MNISKGMQKKFVDEIRFVAEHMEAASTAQEKAYFFSAMPGMAQRIVNFEYDPELVFIHQVGQLVYNTINAWLPSIATRQDRAGSMSEEIFPELVAALEEMAASIEQEQNTYHALQKMVNLAYSTTGNGRYLYLKGLLKI